MGEPNALCDGLPPPSNSSMSVANPISTASSGEIQLSASMSADSSSSPMLTRSRYAALLRAVMASMSSASLRRSLAFTPYALVHALWIISSDALDMSRSSPAMKMTDAMEHANPSHVVTTFALWRRSAL